MTFDLASIGTTRSDDGVPMVVIHPRSRQPVLNDDRTPMTITLLGRNSEPFRETLRNIQLKRAEIANRRETISEDHLYQEDTDTLVACTIDWTIAQFNKQPFPFSARNARQLWTDNHFRWLREAALQFIISDGNFLPVDSRNLSDTPAISSGSTDLSPPAA